MREPRIGPTGLNRRDDARIDGFVAQGFAGGLINKHGERCAPIALTADQPVGTGFDHATDAVASGIGEELRIGYGLDGFETKLVFTIHADKPLSRIAEDDRRLGPPAMRIAMVNTTARQQVSGFDQLVHHRLVGVAEFPRLLAFGLHDLEAAEKWHIGVIGTVWVYRIRDGIERET